MAATLAHGVSCAFSYCWLLQPHVHRLWLLFTNDDRITCFETRRPLSGADIYALPIVPAVGGPAVPQATDRLMEWRPRTGPCSAGPGCREGWRHSSGPPGRADRTGRRELQGCCSGQALATQWPASSSNAEHPSPNTGRARPRWGQAEGGAAGERGCLSRATLRTRGQLNVSGEGDRARLCLRRCCGGCGMGSGLEGTELGARRLTHGCRGLIVQRTHLHRAPLEATQSAGAAPRPRGQKEQAWFAVPAPARPRRGGLGTAL